MFNLMGHLGYRFGAGPTEAGSDIRKSLNTPPPPAPVVMPAPREASDREKAKAFILAGYKPLVAELPVANGPYVSTLLDLLHVQAEDRALAAQKIQALSVAYPNIEEFSEQVINLTFSKGPPSVPKTHSAPSDMAL